MLFNTEAQSKNALSILDEAVYLEEEEVAVDPRQIPVIMMNEDVGVVDYNYVEQLTETFGCSIDEGLDIISETNNMLDKSLYVALQEYKAILDPSLITESTVLIPISHDDLAYRFCEAAIDAYLESGDEGFLMAILDEEDHGKYVSHVMNNPNLTNAQKQEAIQNIKKHAQDEINYENQRADLGRGMLHILRNKNLTDAERKQAYEAAKENQQKLEHEWAVRNGKAPKSTAPAGGTTTSKTEPPKPQSGKGKEEKPSEPVKPKSTSQPNTPKEEPTKVAAGGPETQVKGKKSFGSKVLDKFRGAKDSVKGAAGKAVDYAKENPKKVGLGALGVAAGAAGLLALKKRFDNNKKQQILAQAAHMPRSWIARKIASLRGIYQNFLFKSKMMQYRGQASVFRTIAAKILSIIDALMAKMQYMAG